MGGSYLKGGWKHKYNIQKADGSPVDPKAKYFVLRYDARGDPVARAAMRAYAVNVQSVNPRLAKDILERVVKEQKKVCPQCGGFKTVNRYGPIPIRDVKCPSCNGTGIRKSKAKESR